MTRVAVLFMLVFALTVTGPRHAVSLRHYAGKLPEGTDVKFYLHICSVCGEFYGGLVEWKCIGDKTFHIYYGCVAAILERRRK